MPTATQAIPTGTPRATSATSLAVSTLWNLSALPPTFPELALGWAALPDAPAGGVSSIAFVLIPLVTVWARIYPQMCVKCQVSAKFQSGYTRRTTLSRSVVSLAFLDLVCNPLRLLFDFSIEKSKRIVFMLYLLGFYVHCGT